MLLHCLTRFQLLQLRMLAGLYTYSKRTGHQATQQPDCKPAGGTLEVAGLRCCL
jgi:hypothetical protein